MIVHDVSGSQILLTTSGSVQLYSLPAFEGAGSYAGGRP